MDTVYPISQSAMWGNGGGGSFGGGHSPQNLAPGVNPDAIGGGVIGGGTIGGMHGTGSSALASMLGINLPTGSGSLRESPNLWTAPGPTPQAPLAALNGNSMPMQGIIGGNPHHNSGLIGGVTIGGNNRQGVDAFGGGGNKSDIALLQSLLPGVHITSGGAGGFGAIGHSNINDWNSAPGPQSRPHGSASLAAGDPHQGFNLQSSLGGQPIGQGHHAKQRQAPGSIW
jgi:hypothetical protein